MRLSRISDGRSVNVNLPRELNLTRYESGVLKRWAAESSDLNALQSWAYRNGFEPPTSIEEATTQVDTYTKRTKTGKVVQVKSHDRKVDDHRKLLDAIGVKGDGEGIVDIRMRDDPDLDLLASRGKFISIEGLEFVKGRKHQCHGNAARLFRQGKVDTIATGVAASVNYNGDLTWYQHSWGIKGGKVVETTSNFKKYYGVVLTSGEAKLFAKRIKLTGPGEKTHEAVSNKDEHWSVRKPRWRVEKVSEATVQERIARVKQYARVRKGKLQVVKAHNRQIDQVNEVEKADRQFHGHQVLTKTFMTKTQTGKVGEALTMKLRGGVLVNEYLGEKKNNLAFDVINVRKGILYEVKASQISNKPDNMKWRLTKGEPSKAEKKFLRKASPEIKRMHNMGKEYRILSRKLALMQHVEKLTGKKFKVRTVTYILNPDTRTADFYEFQGLHPIIRWNWAIAKENYRKSYKWR